MNNLRDCPFCGSLIDAQEFDSPAMKIGFVRCACGSQMALPASELADAWNLRRVSDALLNECLGIVAVWCAMLGDYDVDSARERELVNRITEHLGGAA